MASNPLTDQDFQRIVQSLRQLDDAEDIIRRSKQAGLDMSEQERQLRESRERLLKIKQAFFPGR